MTPSRITAIVPALNEALTIGHVVRVLRRSPCIGEVIVVSDGSTDETAAIARREGARVYELPLNMGKGYAVHYGARRADTTYVALFDADLRGLREYHVRRLVNPVLRQRADMSIGLTDRGPFMTKVMEHLPLISGQRVVRRSMLLSIPLEFLSGFRIEAALNYCCESGGERIVTVLLPKVTLRKKIEKVPLLTAIGQYVVMAYEVAMSMIVVRIARRAGSI